MVVFEVVLDFLVLPLLCRAELLVLIAVETILMTCVVYYHYN